MAIFTLGNAIQIAEEAHRGQTDKASEPYILHPLRVMFSFAPYQVHERMTAVLHDTLEDTDLTVTRLINSNCPLDVVEAVSLLTHDKKESYVDYVTRIKNRKNQLALRVKIADIKDNSSLERLLRLEQETTDRLLKKYTEALRILES